MLALSRCLQEVLTAYFDRETIKHVSTIEIIYLKTVYILNNGDEVCQKTHIK